MIAKALECPHMPIDSLDSVSLYDLHCCFAPNEIIILILLQFCVIPDFRFFGLDTKTLETSGPQTSPRQHHQATKTNTAWDI